MNEKIKKCSDRFINSGFTESFIRRLNLYLRWSDIYRYQDEIIKFPNDKYRTVHNIVKWVKWKEGFNTHYGIGIAYHEAILNTSHDRFAPGVLKDMIDKFNNKDIFISLDHSAEIKKEIAIFKRPVKYIDPVFGLSKNEIEEMLNSIKPQIKELMDTIKQTQEEIRLEEFEKLTKKMIQIEKDLISLKQNKEIKCNVFVQVPGINCINMGNQSQKTIMEIISILQDEREIIMKEIKDFMYPTRHA